MCDQFRVREQWSDAVAFDAPLESVDAIVSDALARDGFQGADFKWRMAAGSGEDILVTERSLADGAESGWVFEGNFAVRTDALA